jgi:hypothetical protein
LADSLFRRHVAPPDSHFICLDSFRDWSIPGVPRPPTEYFRRWRGL